MRSFAPATSDVTTTGNATTTRRRRTSRLLRRRSDRRHDVVTNRRDPRHPRHRPVRHRARQPQHRRAQRRHQHGRRRRLLHPHRRERVRRHPLPRRRHRLAVQHRHERRRGTPSCTPTAGRSDNPHMPSTTTWCDSPMPRSSRFPVAACTVSACCASIIGCRGYTGTTPVPSPIRGTCAPATAKQRQGVGPEDLRGEGVGEPRLLEALQLDTIRGSGCSTSSPPPMRSGLAMVLELLT